MSAVEVLRLPLTVDLSGFIALLQRLDVPYRVSEESGEQVLWVPGPQLADQVRGLYQRFPEGDPHFQLADETPRPSPRGSVLDQLKASRLTALVLLLTLAVAALTGLGDNFATIRWLSFQDFQIEGEYLYFTPLAESLAAGQWWRLVTPMLIHFGILHLAMNALWYWELGRRIESRQGGLMLLALTLGFSLVSNGVQYFNSGPSLFGGLSGVLYGLLGHCWVFQRLAPCPAYRLPPGVMAMMLIWLLVCLSGLITALGFGAIANGAHIGGLVAGCATGLLGGAIAKMRR
ncbi:rhomboid family intramembrane serine protease [Metapseudomonas furukawaii]|jgi:GlpG protein|uniref:GlpG protein n=1 Tax=Metapseudomonas furukawaii TaxID=1149133 RepID=A0AAD1C329_METFU|nr:MULTISPECIES: rhomboid family intramembrane serine protease [Pseudomonas]ELS28628.1 GlpG protein (membrane protein of glp regulon) [Pseudomonas furukawaii]OWJ91869.1 rhomboid family intramembrane serine protease [Pseudomonas sp. A46]WAG77222.1 rhomboid family intramembrane serine protease [Pseudomonas furukawaii]BAU75213.1 GlpG protein [Pseudomonas furukawaii]